MVRQAGVIPKTAKRTPATLNRVTTTLRRTMANIPGTGWAVDPATSKVTVWTDDTVTGPRMAAVRRTTSQLGGAIRMVRIQGELSTFALGGDAIFGQGSRCSLGFDVRSGSSTGLHMGRVTATNATVNYAEGSVTGMIQTTVCAEPGDSGGPLFSGNTALGLTSGGSGNCRTGGVTFFQPVTEALQALNANVT